MVLRARPLGPGEVDHELLWLSISLGFLGLAAGWLAIGLPWPQCIFQTFTGHPCVTCGATRSAIAFFRGHFFSAWTWNPLVFVGLCAVTFFDIYAFIVLVTRAPRLRLANFSSIEKNLVRSFVVIAVALNWTYLLSRSGNFS